MLIRRTLLPVWCAAVAVAGAYAITAQVAEPTSGVPGQEPRLSSPAAPADGGACLAATDEPVLQRWPGSPPVDEERLICVDTYDCGGCCGNRPALRRFWACCNGGGGWDCEALCYRKK